MMLSKKEEFWYYVRNWWAYYVGMMLDFFPMGMNLHIWLGLDKELLKGVEEK